ncbi:hypothetical protein E5676_scaffold282G00030 [Cucumis melo var. makuwa]|uniref:Uncharacterized protein n=1 Tax=Cucumis melo var. makuwa TaxID=1194695 RepID=A0A5D3BB37_CUCMM|nr:hypothetical protein E5676_scaffold282G00030 [Cucumis melo var. makuwa]
MKDELETIAWKGTIWDKTPIGKYQLFPHNLAMKANIWLFLMKIKLMPTRHDNTISLDKVMLLYCIMQEISVNVVLALKNYPKTTVKDGICTMASLNHMINLHKNKAGEKRLKKQNKETIHEDEDDIEEKERLVENRRDGKPFQDTFEDSLCISFALIDEVFKDPVDTALIFVGLRSKILEKVVDIPQGLMPQPTYSLELKEPLIEVEPSAMVQPSQSRQGQIWGTSTSFDPFIFCDTFLVDAKKKVSLEYEIVLRDKQCYGVMLEDKHCFKFTGYDLLIVLLLSSILLVKFILGLRVFCLLLGGSILEQVKKWVFYDVASRQEARLRSHLSVFDYWGLKGVGSESSGWVFD